MKIRESSQRNGEETTRNPWDMETNLQYIDKRLAYHVISKDDSFLKRRTLTYIRVHTYMQCVCKRTHKHECAHMHTRSHYGFCKHSKENICVLKVLPVIFSYFFPPAVIIFSPVKQIKTPRPNGGWGSGSDFPLSGSQTHCSYKQALCKETWPVCVCRSLYGDCACIRVRVSDVSYFRRHISD